MSVYKVENFIENQEDKYIKHDGKSYKLNINARIALAIKIEMAKPEGDDFQKIEFVLKKTLGTKVYKELSKTTIDLEETALVVMSLLNGEDPNEARIILASEQGKKFLNAMTQLKTTED